MEIVHSTQEVISKKNFIIKDKNMVNTYMIKNLDTGDEFDLR